MNKVLWHVQCPENVKPAAQNSALSINCGSMPTPLSLISMVIVLALGLYDRTETAPFSGVNLQALRKMFQKTCCKRGASATSSCRDYHTSRS
jgi:hypothetical protein